MILLPETILDNYGALQLIYTSSIWLLFWFVNNQWYLDHILFLLQLLKSIVLKSLKQIYRTDHMIYKLFTNSYADK